MMSISRESALAIAACGLLSTVAVAKPITTDQTRRADCVLEVDGSRYIDGLCDFSPIDTDGSFVVTSIAQQLPVRLRQHERRRKRAGQLDRARRREQRARGPWPAFSQRWMLEQRDGESLRLEARREARRAVTPASSDFGCCGRLAGRFGIAAQRTGGVSRADGRGTFPERRPTRPPYRAMASTLPCSRMGLAPHDPRDCQPRPPQPLWLMPPSIVTIVPVV